MLRIPATNTNQELQLCALSMLLDCHRFSRVDVVRSRGLRQQELLSAPSFKLSHVLLQPTDPTDQPSSARSVRHQPHHESRWTNHKATKTRSLPDWSIWVHQLCAIGTKPHEAKQTPPAVTKSVSASVVRCRLLLELFPVQNNQKFEHDSPLCFPFGCRRGRNHG